MLLLPHARLEERRGIAEGPFRPLAESLRRELAPLLERDLYLPSSKALLSRAGGRCENDGTPLAFDPWSPDVHQCPTCGTAHRGDLHHRAWITWYQLWLAERAVHAALLHLLRPSDDRLAALARSILGAYAERYRQYPNRDNVLGPTRLFFSTYLESIWLLQICVAADLLRAAGDEATSGRVIDAIVEPSSALIADYDEGMSNRQVWNNAALLAAAGLRSDDATFDRLLDGPSGLHGHLAQALFPDGTWYEGENYHLFALRGLWYAVALAEARGRPLAPALADRYHRAFLAPFLTALPDFTLPSRKDSQYRISLRQWRIAELVELGAARRADPPLRAALARLYDGTGERRPTGRDRSAADVERNEPPTALTRADLGWRALLHGDPGAWNDGAGATTPGRGNSGRSALLEHQGYAVFRRDGGVYVGVEFGQTGGGHGHPDRLNLVLAQDEIRWLDDLGTGSYVDPSLHWYRSTLAHNAPIVNGRSQPLRAARLRAHEEREGLGWIVAELELPEDGVRLERTIVVAPDYLVDELRWSAPAAVRVELPIHVSPVGMAALKPARFDGGARPEDGYVYVDEARAASHPAGAPVELEVRRDDARLRIITTGDGPFSLFSVVGPAQPATRRERFVVLRGHGDHGCFRSLVAWGEHVDDATLDEPISVRCRGERHEHRRDDAGWHVTIVTDAGGARSSIDLAGWREPAPAPTAMPSRSREPIVVRRAAVVGDRWLSDLDGAARADLVTFELRETHYRRSEDSWTSAGAPSATIGIVASAAELILLIDVRAGEPRFAAADAENPYDNEAADTMRAGVQVYVRAPTARGGWMLVPEHDAGRVRVRSLAEWTPRDGAAPGGERLAPPAARWRETRTGYEMRLTLALPAADAELPLDLDVLVNETVAGRERRRGQLVLSGAPGEFVYLRGDRQDASRLLPVVIVG